MHLEFKAAGKVGRHSTMRETAQAKGNMARTKARARAAAKMPTRAKVAKTLVVRREAKAKERQKENPKMGRATKGPRAKSTSP